MREENQKEKRLSEAYDKTLKNVREILSSSTDITRSKFEDALKRGSRSLEGASRFTQEEVEKARKAVKKDWQNLTRIAQERRTDLMKSEQFQKIADKSLGVLGKLIRSVKDWADILDQKIDEQLTYHTGEIAGPGQFRCTECGKTLTFKKSGRIPPCGKCRKTVFKRIVE